MDIESRRRSLFETNLGSTWEKHINPLCLIKRPWITSAKFPNSLTLLTPFIWMIESRIVINYMIYNDWCTPLRYNMILDIYFYMMFFFQISLLSYVNRFLVFVSYFIFLMITLLVWEDEDIGLEDPSEDNELVVVVLGHVRFSRCIILFWEPRYNSFWDV